LGDTCILILAVFLSRRQIPAQSLTGSAIFSLILYSLAGYFQRLENLLLNILKVE